MAEEVVVELQAVEVVAAFQDVTHPATRVEGRHTILRLHATDGGMRPLLDRACRSTRPSHALLTTPPMSTDAFERSESSFASNADIQWPSFNSMIGIVGDSCMSAAALVPFTQRKKAEMQASTVNAPVQPTFPPAQPEHAKIVLPLASLTLQQLQSLKEKCPDAHREVKVQVPVAKALLERTDMLATASAPVSSSTSPSSSVNPIAASSAPPCKRDADGMPDLSSYLEQTAGVNKVSEGFSLAHEGRSLGGLGKVIWDTGSEINLISESFAKAANIRYDTAHGPTVGGSGGRYSHALGRAECPQCMGAQPSKQSRIARQLSHFTS